MVSYRQLSLGATLAALACAGCASTVHPDDAGNPRAESAQALHALAAHQPEQARRWLANALRDDPQNADLHLLNALTYDLEGRTPQLHELAQVGYGSAARLAPGDYWSHYFAGISALGGRDYTAAADDLAAAILANPDDAAAWRALAIAAYYAGDLPVAARAAARAEQLAPKDPGTLRIAAFVAAAQGDKPALERMQARMAGTHELDSATPRLAMLLRTAAVEQVPATGAAGAGTGGGAAGGGSGAGAGVGGGAAGAPAPESPPSQVMVEVTLLLSQNSTARYTGINLLDGLSLQFGGQKNTHFQSDSPGAQASQQVLTTALSVPQITYSLNFFNTKNDYYEVVARPSLVASMGQESNFFVGRTVIIGVSGVNLGSLQPIDIGTSVKVTPVELSTQKAKFRVETGRSFFAQETNGSFQQSLTTFKQTVAATVEVEFGKTLILSGLYEGVGVGGNSATPVLGSVPIVDTLFNSRNHTTRKDVALVLVTPRLAGEVATPTREFRTETLQRVFDLWNTFIEPTAGLNSTLEVLKSKTRYLHAQAGDLPLPDTRDPAMLARLLADESRRLK